MAAMANYSCASGTLSGFNCLGALTRTRYEAYGNTAAGAVRPGIGFTGHVNDADTGLVYMQQRYYDPIAGRFLSVDPIVTDADTGKGFNLYEYVSSNPYGARDPDGRAEERLINETNLGRGGAAAELGGGWAGPPSRMIRTPADARAAGAADRAAATRAAESAKGPEGAKTGEAARKETGSYTNTHESGKTYDGKGSRERSQESGRRVEAETGDKHTSTDWTPAQSSRDAFKQEAKRLDSNGSSKSDSNYNKIESPGKKMLQEDAKKQ
jgi:RHS repeat-associated protein